MQFNTISSAHSSEPCSDAVLGTFDITYFCFFKGFTLEPFVFEHATQS